MSVFRKFLARVKKTGVRRPGAVTTTSLGLARTFRCWDVGDDTFVFEDGVTAHLDERPSVLIVEKRDLGRRARGRLMTVTTGYHSVAAFPTLDGRFWKLSNISAPRRGEVLTRDILCANVVSDRLELSQRDVSPQKLFAADRWLLGSVGFKMGDVVILERSDAAMEHYRSCGEEWRVKPLAWTESGMKVALAASRKKIFSSLRYYHSSRGVHFLSYSEFRRLCDLAATDPVEFARGLSELVSVQEGNRRSFTRLPKHRGHHEIEFFGLRRGVAEERLLPELERLMEAIALGRISAEETARRARSAADLCASLLTQPALADEDSREFVETMYMYVTGEVYAVEGEGSTPAFDDRRTALPGATFEDGRPHFHPGCDDRSEVLLANLRAMVSKDEQIEYANVYELRDSDGDVPLGQGTREIVYKTNRSPLERSLVEKRLKSGRKGYGSYVLARLGALRELGIGFSDFYRMLRRRHVRGHGAVDFYIRSRCPGEPLEAIPANYFCSVADSTVEDREVVLALASLMGDAAAQNMAMKKYDSATQSPLFGVGKEVYDFEYDIVGLRVVPKAVRTCSLRGCFGWPTLTQDEANLAALSNFYLGYYAHALKSYALGHSAPMPDLAGRFFDGFAYRTRAMAWQLSVMRDRFEAFRPDLPKEYDFDRKWRFVMWSLDRQERRLSALRRLFLEKVAVEERGGTPEPAPAPSDEVDMITLEED